MEILTGFVFKYTWKLKTSKSEKKENEKNAKEKIITVGNRDYTQRDTSGYNIKQTTVLHHNTNNVRVAAAAALGRVRLPRILPFWGGEDSLGRERDGVAHLLLLRATRVGFSDFLKNKGEGNVNITHSYFSYLGLLAGTGAFLGRIRFRFPLFARRLLQEVHCISM